MASAPDTAKRARDADPDTAPETIEVSAAKKIAVEDDEWPILVSKVTKVIEKAVGVKVSEIASKKDPAEALAFWEATCCADPHRCLSDGNVDEVDPDELNADELDNLRDTIASYAAGEATTLALYVFEEVQTLAEAGRYIHVAQEYLDEVNLTSSATAAEITELERLKLLAALGEQSEFEDLIEAFAESLLDITDVERELKGDLQQKRCVLVFV